MTRMTRTKKIVSILFINLVLFTFFIYSFESLFSPYSDLPVNGIVNGEWYTWGHRVKNNRHGFREKDFSYPKPTGTIRIMVLGDSFTWGEGLAVHERYTAIAEKLLNENFPDRKFEVLNFGIRNVATTKERDVLHNFHSKVDPDLIVVGFCLNDPQPRSQSYSIEREKLQKSGLGQFVQDTSLQLRHTGVPYTGKLIFNSFYRAAELLDIIPAWQVSLQRSYEPSSNDWKNFIIALKDIKNITDKLNLPPPFFIVLNQGTSTKLPTNYMNPDENLKLYLKWYSQAEEAAKEIGFISHNHEYEISHQLQNESLAVNVLDGHPSANLNRVYGKKLYEQIITKKVLAAPGGAYRALKEN